MLITLTQVVGALGALALGLGFVAQLYALIGNGLGLAIGNKRDGVDAWDNFGGNGKCFAGCVVAISTRGQIEARVGVSTRVTQESTFCATITLTTRVCGLAIIGAYKSVGDFFSHVACSTLAIAFLTKIFSGLATTIAI